MYIQTLILYTIAVLSLHTLASISVTKLLTVHRYCAYTLLFHFRISTFSLHYVKMDGKWDSQRKSSHRFFNSHFVKLARILWVCECCIWTLPMLPLWTLPVLPLYGLSGSVGCVVRLETRRLRVQPLLRLATFFRGDWSWNIYSGYSLPSADSRRAVVSFWRKNVHSTG